MASGTRAARHHPLAPASLPLAPGNYWTSLTRPSVNTTFISL